MIVAKIAFYSLSEEVSARHALLSDCRVDLFEQIHGDIQQDWFIVSFWLKQSSLLGGEYIYLFEQHSGGRI
jgi:hypothetical protein